MPETPLFSVVIPAYNCAAFVEEAIASALAQTVGRSAVEVIVLDDGSTDDTERVVREFGDAVRFVQLDHGGVSRARNAGIERASAPYVAFLDADDYWFPRRLERVHELLSQEKRIFANTDYFVETDGELAARPYYQSRSYQCLFELDARAQFEFAIEDNFISIMTVVPRAALIDAGGFNPQLRYGEDWDLWLRLLDAGYAVRLVREACAVYRFKRPGATTTRHDLGMASDRLFVLSRYPSAVSPHRRRKATALARRLRMRQAVARFLPGLRT